MRYKVIINGDDEMLHHSVDGALDPSTPINKEKQSITSKKVSNRTGAEEERLRELECLSSVWWDESGQKPTIPAKGVRSMLEAAAKKLRQGPMVREGLIVEKDVRFWYDEEACGSTPEEIGKKAQFTVAVRVQQSRMLRTRAKFSKWGAEFILEVDDELIDLHHLESWLEISGRRLGFGDWRPQTSGHYGRFTVESIKLVE